MSLPQASAYTEDVEDTGEPKSVRFRSHMAWHTLHGMVCPMLVEV